MRDSSTEAINTVLFALGRARQHFRQWCQPLPPHHDTCLHDGRNSVAICSLTACGMCAGSKAMRRRGLRQAQRTIKLVRRWTYVQIE
jgi:hypothetical protein